MKELKFIFQITPEVKERPRFSIINGKAHVRTSAKTKHFENTIALMARSQMAGKQKLVGLIEARFYFHFKKPSKTKLHVPRKDLDNLVKSLFDSLNEIAYEDDQQIFYITGYKSWGEKDEISLELLSNEQEGGK